MINKLRIRPKTENTTGKIVFNINGKNSDRCAFLVSDKVKIKIEIPRSLMASDLMLDIYDETEEKRILSLKCKWTDIIGENDVYEVSLPIEKIGVGLYFFDISFKYGSVYNKTLQISYKSEFSAEIKRQKKQFSISDFVYKNNTEHLGGVIYHIFVDRFNKTASKKRDGLGWNDDIPEFPEYPGAPIKNEYMYGGTLKGITEKLDYIKSLGTTIIYLSPIFKSPSNHKYDTADYRKVDKAFGGESALRELISEAKKRKIGIILDGVFNHTGSDSLYFNKYGKYKCIGAYQSKESKYYSWYEFQEFPDKYTSWWGIDILPRINTQNSNCQNYFVGRRGIIAKYRKMGILGFRLDVVDELSDEFIEKIKSRLEKNECGSLLYGEVWEDASNKIAYGMRKKYYLGKELDGVMNYPLRAGIISFLKNYETGRLLYYLCDIINNTPKRILDMQMNLLGSHDTERIITLLGGEDSFGKTNEYLHKIRMNESEYLCGRRKLMMAYTAIATLPGLPTVYYADEVGLEGYSDPFNRRTFPWGDEDEVLLSHFRLLGKIRKSHKVYRKGEFKLIYLDNEILIFKRTSKKYDYVTVVNNRSEELNLSFSKKVESLILKKEDTDFFVAGQSSEIFKAIKNTVVRLK